MGCAHKLGGCVPENITCENNVEAVGKKVTHQALLGLHFVMRFWCSCCGGANTPAQPWRAAQGILSPSCCTCGSRGNIPGRAGSCGSLKRGLGKQGRVNKR